MNPISHALLETARESERDAHAEETPAEEARVFPQSRWEHIQNGIAGYYTYGEYILRIALEDHALIVQKVNVIHTAYVQEEIIRFAVDRYDPAADCFSDGEHCLSVLFGYAGRLYALSLRTSDHESRFPAYPGGAGALMDYIAKTLNEAVMKYTYDYQKRFTGTYGYDASVLFGMEADEWDAVYKDEWTGRELSIAIDDEGFLFIADAAGNACFSNWKTKIIDEHKATRFFGNIPADGPSVQLYFFNHDLIWERDFNGNAKKYQVRFKKK
jgi:hypothetical protein